MSDLESTFLHVYQSHGSGSCLFPLTLISIAHVTHVYNNWVVIIIIFSEHDLTLPMKPISSRIIHIIQKGNTKKWPKVDV